MKLAVQIEFDKMLNFETSQNVVTVGRSTESNLVISHHSISRSHCKIEYVNHSFFITDLKSLNGTFIDGAKLVPHQKTILHAHSTLKLGLLSCYLTDSSSSLEKSKLHPTQVLENNLTSTTLASRLEVENLPGIHELEQKKKIKGPRNPITQSLQVPEDIQDTHPREGSKKIFIILLILVALAVSYLLKMR